MGIFGRKLTPKESPNQKLEILVVVGSLLIFGFLWIFVQPPFSSVDEPHHAARAWSAANVEMFADSNRGKPRTQLSTLKTIQWSQPDSFAPGPPSCYLSQGPGITANHCGEYPWNLTNEITIKNQMSQFFPTYYYPVGFISKFFSGAKAYYGMRFIGLLLSGLTMILAFYINLKFQFIPPSILGFLYLPMTVQQAGTLSPLSVETTASILMLVSLVAISKKTAEKQFFLNIVAAISGWFVVSTRPTGVIWLPLILFMILMYIKTYSSLLFFLKQNKMLFSIFISQEFLLLIYQYFHHHETEPYLPDGYSSVRKLLLGSALNTYEYFRNAIGIFGQTGVFLPEIVYSCYFALFLLIFYETLRYRKSRHLSLIIISIFISLVFLPNVVAREIYFLAYQGRYGLPVVTSGLLLLLLYQKVPFRNFFWIISLLSNTLGIMISALRFSYGLTDTSPESRYNLVNQSMQYDIPFLGFSGLIYILATVLLANLIIIFGLMSHNSSPK